MRVQDSCKPNAEGRLRSGRWLLFLLLIGAVVSLSGCVITPIAAQRDGEDGAVSVTIAVAPPAGAPGTEVYVSGAGWRPNETVYVNLETTPDTEPIQNTVAIADADAQGRFNVTFSYPVDPVWREPGIIEIVAYSLEDRTRAVAPFEVEAGAAPTATPTSTARPTTAAPATGTPRPTPTPTSVSKTNVAEVVSSALNVRSGPSTAFPVERSIRRGTKFVVLGQNQSGAWLLVRLSDGTEGWLARAYTNFDGRAAVVPTPSAPKPTATPKKPSRPPFITGWRGEYYGNRTLSGSPVLVRDDQSVDFDWGNNAPAAGMPRDNFSVRWVRSIFLPAGNYRFFAQADDGVRVWVDGELLIDEWHAYSGETYRADKRLDSGSHLIRIEYYDAREIAKVRFWWAAAGDYPQWRGEYYSNPELRGAPAFVRNDSAVDFDWGRGGPASNFPSDDFSVRWTRDVHFDAGDYRFRIHVDDGMRVYLDDNLIIDEWRDGSVRERTRDIYVGHGTHRLRVEYYEKQLYAVAKLSWERVSDDFPDDFDDWKGEYYTNEDLDGSPRLVRDDDKIDFDWGTGSPDSRIPDNHFSARWTQRIDFDDARYRFYARADDGVRVYVGDDRIINEWHDSDGDEVYTAEKDLDGDERVKVEYYERTGGARVHVWWEKISATPTPTTGPQNPYLDLVPDQGGAGTRVTAVGGGFPANTTVNLYLGGVARASAQEATDAQIYASTTTDRQGNYSMSFDMPATWPDDENTPIEEGRLLVNVATADFSVEAGATFDYLSSQPTQSPDPYAQVSPSSGGAGTRVTVSGGGFPANTSIRVHLAGLAGPDVSAASAPESFANGTTDGLGNYSVSFNMPEEWPDGDEVETGKLIILVATTDFSVEASADFDYFVDAPNPSINLDPSSGTADTQVRVSGSGFPANTTVNLYLAALGEQPGSGRADQIYASTVADRNGNYSLSFGMPRIWTDGEAVKTGRIVVLVANSDFSVTVSDSFNYTAPDGEPGPTATPTATPVATATPTREPYASISPGSGGAGTDVTISGGGFPPNVSVSAYLGEFEGDGGYAAEGERYATDTTNGAGEFSLTFTMPERWPDGDRIESGRVAVIVATNDFGSLVSRSFRYDAVESSAAEPTATPTDTPAPTATATATPSPRAEDRSTQPIEDATDTPEPTSTATAAPTNTPVPTETATPEPTDTPAPTDTPMPEPTNTPEEDAVGGEDGATTGQGSADEPDSSTATPVPTATATNTPAPTDTPTPTATYTPAPEPTDTSVPTDTPMPEPTNTPAEDAGGEDGATTGQGSAEDPVSSTNTPTATATNTLTATPTLTNTVVPTDTAVPEDSVGQED